MVPPGTSRNSPDAGATPEFERTIVLSRPLLQLRTIAGGTNQSPPARWKVLLGKLGQHQIFVLVGLGLCMIVAAGFVLARSSPVDADDWRSEVVIAAQQAVRHSVRNEIRTSFAGKEETEIEELAESRYRLGGWVDLISDDGQIARQHFACIVFRDINGDWDFQDLSVTPQ
jgi:hypothetical protein